MKRLFDLILAVIAILLLPIIIVAVLVKLTLKGTALYWFNRAGLIM